MKKKIVTSKPSEDFYFENYITCRYFNGISEFYVKVWIVNCIYVDEAGITVS